MKIIPYIYYKDAWSLSYDTIEDIWNKMVDEGTSKMVFPSGNVKDMESFKTCLQNKKSNVITIWENKEIVFLSWINNLKPTSASIHFTSFKSIWGTRTDEALLMAFRHWFSHKDNDGEYLFDTIMGMIPNNNQRAIEMTKRCGVHVLGTIPNYTTNFYTKKKIGATVLYIERSEVLNGLCQ